MKTKKDSPFKTAHKFISSTWECINYMRGILLNDRNFRKPWIYFSKLEKTIQVVTPNHGCLVMQILKIERLIQPQISLNRGLKKNHYLENENTY